MREEDEFIVEPFTPACLALFRSGELRARADAARRALQACRLCPRRCGVNRHAGELGFCRTDACARVTSAFAHHGEEGCLRGSRGSGTIFFNRCNLQCVFCQNSDISQAAAGRPVTAQELAETMLALQGQGCHNINFVSPSHVLPQILEALVAAVAGGLSVPLVWNSGGYDGLEALALLDGVVDVYMPDFKFWEPETARRLALAADYPERAREALKEMHRQTGVLRCGRDGLARRGVLVRHLVMPGLCAESAAIFRWLAKELSPDTFVNVMAQYHPDNKVGLRDSGGGRLYPDIDRRITTEEYRQALAAAASAGLWRFAE
ncbi:MAG: radical SAM protein [Planctomycetota bacterium]|nr:radical SAM protein [Planctomycetota bacterium]